MSLGFEFVLEREGSDPNRASRPWLPDVLDTLVGALETLITNAGPRIPGPEAETDERRVTAR